MELCIISLQITENSPENSLTWHHCTNRRPNLGNELIMNQRLAIVVPVLNGGDVWRRAANALKEQQPKPDLILVIDSGSNDGSAEIATEYGFQLKSIDKKDFDHGGTRQMAADSLDQYDIIVYATQDAVMASPDAVSQLVAAFDDPDVGMAYGRQLPRKEADPIEAHARLFNYPSTSDTRTIDDIPRLGIKAAFSSNSFAAYRTSALSSVGGFPVRLIMSEDMVVTAKALIKGWKVAYVATACAYHSHGYTLAEEFRRYFDIGAFHQDQSWLIETFGKPEGEGGRFVRSEFKFLLRKAPWLIPSAILRTLAKYFGYKLGQKSTSVPRAMKLKISMHKGFWK